MIPEGGLDRFLSPEFAASRGASPLQEPRKRPAEGESENNAGEVGIVGHLEMWTRQWAEEETAIQRGNGTDSGR